jgi:hypothetical protein
MAPAFRFRHLLPCLLALCLAGLGPAALAALPRAINPGSEEETRSAAEDVIGSVAPARSRAPGPPGRRDSGEGLADFVGRPATRVTVSSAVASPTLRTLKVRTQV